MNASWRFLVPTILLAFSTRADVMVLENVSPGATSWPGSPLIATVANPSASSVGESFDGGGGNTSLGQTFTVTTTNYTLLAVSLYAGIGTGTAPGTNLTLNLYDLGVQSAPNPSPYTASIVGGNLLGSGAGLSISYFSQTPGVLEFDFTGADQVYLQAGHMYAFELSGVLGTAPAYWYRGISDTYSGGAAYRSQSWINGNNARDFAMAIYATVNTNPPPAFSAQCTIDWNDVHQRIDGFGASSAWQSTWTTALADMLFSTNSGTGTSRIGGVHYTYSGIALSLLRNHIKTDGISTDETSIMQMAQSRGARLWSTPWSPPAQYKSSGSVNGGNFVTAGNNYGTYAGLLAKYVVNMNNLGLNLYALSVQNEPDFNTTNYESCVWTGNQFHDFLPSLSSAFAASNVAYTKIILAESENWKFDLVTNSMNDLTTSNLVGILAAHSYGTPEATVVNSYGKPLWETEDSLLSGSDSSITNGIFWAQEIHNYMTVAQANAWHYWWLLASSGATGNQGLGDTNWIPAKRMYTVGNFSRFVRPGYYRLGVINNSAAQISAYKYPNSGNFAIVAINGGGTSITQAFNLAAFPAPASVGTWITSSNLSLTNLAATTVSNSSFSYVLPPLSVVTFVWQTNLAPADITLLHPFVPENQPIGTAVGPFVTTDPDPGNTFSYALVSGTGSGDNGSFSISSNRLFTAASFNYEIKSNYTIRVRSTDQSGLFFEKVFTIAIAEVNEPPATPANVSPGNAAANQQPDLTLQSSAFNDPDAGDTQAAAEWLVRRAADNALVFDSGPDPANLNSISLSQGVLDYGTAYNWQVRYEDSRNAWSSYSATTTFTTVAPDLTTAVQGGSLVLSWPANTTDFLLEYATNLVAPAWAPVSPPPALVGEQFVLTNSMTDAAGFFRLRKP